MTTQSKGAQLDAIFAQLDTVSGRMHQIVTDSGLSLADLIHLPLHLLAEWEELYQQETDLIRRIAAVTLGAAQAKIGTRADLNQIHPA